MPPKNKNAEEEAKRLEEERKRKQQQEALLQLQKKKYQGQTLQSGLYLPVTSQLILDFKSKSLEFLDEKLKENLKQPYPTLEQSSNFAFIMKELHYYIKDSTSVFGEPDQPEHYLKHRILIAIMFKTLLNEEPSIGGSGKIRENDEKLMKTQVATQCNKKLLTKSEGLKILDYAGERYFGRFLLIKMHKKFSKKQTQTRKDIYIETPCVIGNNLETKFIDLSEKKQEEAKE